MSAFFLNQEPVDDLQGEELVRASRGNVLIETLGAGTIGLPVVAEPIYLVEHPSGFCKFLALLWLTAHLPSGIPIALKILSPPILLLTKMKRWYHNRESTYPKFLSKNKSDKSDIDFLIGWLFENDMKINFDLYQGKEKPELLKFVRAYHDKFREDLELMEILQEILHQEDWDELQAIEETSTSESELPSELSQGTLHQEGSDALQVASETSASEPDLPAKSGLLSESLQAPLHQEDSDVLQATSEVTSKDELPAEPESPHPQPSVPLQGSHDQQDSDTLQVPKTPTSESDPPAPGLHPELGLHSESLQNIARKEDSDAPRVTHKTSAAKPQLPTESGMLTESLQGIIYQKD